MLMIFVFYFIVIKHVKSPYSLFGKSYLRLVVCTVAVHPRPPVAGSASVALGSGGPVPVAKMAFTVAGPILQLSLPPVAATMPPPGHPDDDISAVVVPASCFYSVPYSHIFFNLYNRRHIAKQVFLICMNFVGLRQQICICANLLNSCLQ
jgi:hypothetical protein